MTSEDRAFLVNASALAASRVRARLERTPNARVSKDGESLQSLLATIEATLDGYPNDSATRITKVLRALAQSDDDVRGTLRDLIALVNPGYTLDFTGGARAIKAAQAELDAFTARVYPEGGGLDGLINNQIAEFAVAGASSLEWFPTRGRNGVQDVAVVPAEEIRITRDAETHALKHEQQVAGQRLTLSPVTYHYAAAQTAGRSPYGVPLFVAALFALERKRQLLAAEQRVINLMARSALVKANVPKPSPADLGVRGLTDPGYPDALAAYYAEVADLLAAGSENGIYVGPDGVTIDVLPVTQSAAGAGDITKANQKRVWNALGTYTFLRGENENTPQALAQVAIPMLYAQAINVQNVLAAAIAFGLNLHLRLKGIAAVVTVKFDKPKSPFLLDEANAELARAKTDEIMNRLVGPAWAAHVQRRWDITDDDFTRAPDWWPSPSAPSPEPGGST